MKKVVILLFFSFFNFSLFSQEICSDYSACNYAYEGVCEYAENYYDCNDVCLNDIDDDGVCDELEISGCTDGFNDDGNPMACNFNPIATDDDGSCIYPGLIYDCDGVTCLNDSDGDFVCDENEILGCNDENAYNFDILATENDNSCFYPIFGCLNPLGGNYNPYADIDDGSCIFSPWPYNSTDCNMIILIPEEANLLIDDYDLQYGDWIGAFYKNENDELICGGSVMWKGETTSIAIWGSENGEDNGFDNNEEITWKVFLNQSENILIPNYTFGVNFYNCNSLGGLGSLSIYNQEIYLPPGWTIFSSYIIPIENNVEKIFENVEDIVIIKDQNGDVYWPDLGINQIGGIDFNEGYIIKMNYESSGYNVIISGEAVPSNIEMSLNDGWNIISYLNREPALVEEMMSPIEESLIIIKDEDGLIYWPMFGVNSMNIMNPGRGYQVKITENLVFSYETSSNTRFFQENNLEETKYFFSPKSTGENMTIGIPLSSWSELPSIGDEIGVFSQDGLLVGCQVFNGEPTAISIWGDDISTFEKDGMNIGEKFYFKLWDNNLQKEKFLKVDSWIEGLDFYNVNSINIAGNISFFSDCIFEKELIQVFDISGKKLSSLKKNQIGFFLYNDRTITKQLRR